MLDLEINTLLGPDGRILIVDFSSLLNLNLRLGMGEACPFNENQEARILSKAGFKDIKPGYLDITTDTFHFLARYVTGVKSGNLGLGRFLLNLFTA